MNPIARLMLLMKKENKRVRTIIHKGGKKPPRVVLVEKKRNRK
jgi:hypothetical protein